MAYTQNTELAFQILGIKSLDWSTAMEKAEKWQITNNEILEVIEYFETITELDINVMIAILIRSRIATAFNTCYDYEPDLAIVGTYCLTECILTPEGHKNIVKLLTENQAKDKLPSEVFEWLEEQLEPSEFEKIKSGHK